MTVLGIDLGSKFSTVAHVNADGVATLIPDAQDGEAFRTPSVIHSGPSGRLVGQAALIASLAQPGLPLLRDAKWLLGCDGATSQASRATGLSAQQGVGLLLDKLRSDATACGESVDGAVLAVPRSFTADQCRALRAAAAAIDLPVRALVDESIAAAMQLVSNWSQPTTALVLHLGSRTCETTIVRGGRGSMQVLATKSQTALGGRWVDERIVDQMRPEFERQHGPIGQDATIQLAQLAEQLKLDLCRSSSGQVKQQALLGKGAFEFVLTRFHFERMIRTLVAKCLDLCSETLAEARLDWADIGSVLLVGGAAQMPAVRREFEQRSGLPTERIVSDSGHAAIAYGAALLAMQDDVQLGRFALNESGGASASAAAGDREAGNLPLAKFDIGIRIGDPRSSTAAIYRLIKRSSPLPATAMRQFRTSRPGQTRLVIDVVQALGSTRRAVSLGQFAIELPAGLPANHAVAVTMCCDVDGQVEVKASA
ncbi:MAG: Hsp70 family protein [Aureliella sp.]